MIPTTTWIGVNNKKEATVCVQTTASPNNVPTGNLGGYLGRDAINLSVARRINLG
jgi:hypothetical protein